MFNRFVSAFRNEMYFALSADCFEICVSDAPGRVSDCYIVKLVKIGDIEQLGNPAIRITDEQERRIVRSERG